MTTAIDSVKRYVQVALSVVQKGLRPTIPTTCTTAQASIIRVRDRCVVWLFVSVCCVTALFTWVMHAGVKLSKYAIRACAS
jgi:hypothetical protein